MDLFKTKYVACFKTVAKSPELYFLNKWNCKLGFDSIDAADRYLKLFSTDDGVIYDGSHGFTYEKNILDII